MILKKRSVLLARLKAKQMIRKVREQQQQQVNNATTSNLPVQPPPEPTYQPGGFSSNNGAGIQP